MKRMMLTYLMDWLASSDRKPLVIRGARQVGKTWLVRHFSEVSKKKLIELNFEKQPHLTSLFDTNDARQIILHLSSVLEETIDAKNTLLFLDEIQAAPELLAKLRWFAEELPELPVIAAGSLLEFVLAGHTFSMPVGRVSYAYLEPLSFEEFLLAQDKPKLCEFLKSYILGQSIPEFIHQQYMSLLREYMIVGGMPAAVSNWVKDRSLVSVNRIHHDLLSTYRDDFSKYAGRLAITRLDEVMRSVPRLLGEKFIYSKINSEVQSRSIKQGLELLLKARLCHVVKASYANGVPLGAEINEKYFKVIFIDIGLVSSALGLKVDSLKNIEELILVNKGGVSEQLVGQLLRTIEQPYAEPNLYYWVRQDKTASAEIDYLIEYQNRVIPVEVKSGSIGSLKSLHLFLFQKKLNFGLRFNSAVPSRTHISAKIHTGESVNYELVSLPFYLIGQLYRLLS